MSETKLQAWAVRDDSAVGGWRYVFTEDLGMTGGKYQAWALVGTGVKTDQFQTVQEAITWASEYGEWAVFERVSHGWRAVRHGGERGQAAATAVPGSAAD